MSLDLSDPEVVQTQTAILSKTDPTTWFLLTYSSPHSKLCLVASGPNPALPTIRERLADTSEDVLFGYAEVHGKGLVIAFMKDNVGGVRRARAVVHSRSVATLFPDYAALVTVAHHSQLTDELVDDKLGFDPSRGFLPPSVQPSAQSAGPSQNRNQDHLSRRVPIPIDTTPTSKEPSPPVPAKDYSISATLPEGRGSSSSLHSQLSKHSKVSAKERPSTPLQEDLDMAGETTPRRQDDRKMTTPSGKPSPLPLAPPVDIHKPFPFAHPHHNPSHRIVSAPVHSPSSHQGISSSDLFPDNRNRKTSLTSRFGSAFGRTPKTTSSPASTSPNSPVETKSPSSPGMSRFKNSNLVKNFGRRSSGGATPPASPHTANRQSHPPPPLPPKDEDVIAYTPPSEILARESEDTAATVTSNGMVKSEESDFLARSESAQKVLTDASQKRVKDEGEIQDRFRRDQEEMNRSRMSGGRGPEDDDGIESILVGHSPDSREMKHSKRMTMGPYGDDEEFGLPYDRPGPDSPEAETNALKRPGVVAIPSTLSISHPAHPLHLGPPIEPTSPSRSQPLALVDSANPYEPHPGHAAQIPGVSEMGIDEPNQGLGRELEGDESVTEQIMEMELAEEGDAGGIAVELSVQAEEHAREERARREAQENATREADTARIEHNERERARYEDVRREQERRLEEIRQAAAARQEEEAKRVEEIRLAEEREERARREEQAEYEESQRQMDEVKRQEEEEMRERLRLMEIEKADRARREEEERRMVEEERAAEEERRREAERREAKRREEERVEELKREEERRVAEEKRIEEERVAAEQRKEAERVAEEQRIEEQKVREEERKVQEEKRKEEAREAAVRQKKEDTLNGLRTSRHNGEVMVSGWITVQTLKSVVWRRRWFNLLANEIRLFKTEGDVKPIQVVPLGQNAKVSQRYEESQVQGSFKVIDQTGEEWFMFTDGAEEKELVLSALAVTAE